MRSFIQNACVEIAQRHDLEMPPLGFSADDEQALLSAAANSELEDLYDTHLHPMQVSAWELSIGALARKGTRLYSARSKYGNMLPNGISTGWVALSSKLFEGTERVVPAARITARSGMGDGAPPAIYRRLPKTNEPHGRQVRKAEAVLGSVNGLGSVWFEACLASPDASALDTDNPRMQSEAYYTKHLTNTHNRKMIAKAMEDIGDRLVPDLTFWSMPLPESRIQPGVEGVYIPHPSRRDALFRPVSSEAAIDSEMTARRVRMANIIAAYELIAAMGDPLRNDPLFRNTP